MNPSVRDVVPYVRADHGSMVGEWCEQWGIATKLLDYLPTTGYVVVDLAAAFLYETNSPVAFIDVLISNRNAAEEDRTEALDAVVQAVCARGWADGYEIIWGYSQHQDVLTRAGRLGFTVDRDSRFGFVSFRPEPDPN